MKQLPTGGLAALAACLVLAQPCLAAGAAPATRKAKAEEKVEAPPARTRAEVEALLGKEPAPDEQADAGLRPLRVLLVAGKKDHGPGQHDYPAWQKRWEALLAKAPQVKVSTAFGRPEQRAWDEADLMVFYCWGTQFWDDASYKQLDAFLARGGGLVVFHSGVITEPPHAQGLADRIGFAWTPKGTKYRHGPLELTFTKPDHPIARGYDKLRLVDEDYWPILYKAGGGAAPPEVLATTPDDGGEWPMLWTFRPGPAGGRDKGRVYCTTLGHYAWTFDDPLARALMLRGMAWAAGEPAERFRRLVLDGITLREEPPR